MKFAKTARILILIPFFFGMASKPFTQDVAFNDSIAIRTVKRRPEQVIQNGNLSKIQIAKAADNRVNFGLVVSE